MRSILVGLCLLVGALFTFGCASGGDAAPTPMTIPQLDQATMTAIQARIKGDGELAGEIVKVSAKGDTVVLEGSVQTADEKERAEKLARSVKGVNKVDNKLEIKPNP
jgi:osmotically-inducible protein OsmY